MKPKGYIEFLLLRVSTLREICKKKYMDNLLKSSLNYESFLELSNMKSSSAKLENLSSDTLFENNETHNALQALAKQDDLISKRNIVSKYLKNFRFSEALKREIEEFKICIVCNLSCYESHIRMYSLEKSKKTKINAICSMGCADKDTKFVRRALYYYRPSVHIN